MTGASITATRFASCAAAALLTIAVAGCSDDSPPVHSSSSGTPRSTRASAEPSGGSSGASARGSSAADAAIAKVMGSSDKLPVLASSKGTLQTSTGSSAVIAEVLQVKASADATRVTWRLKSATSATADTKSFQLARPPLFDTRQLGVVDPKTKHALHPYTYVPVSGHDGQDNACACSDLPDSVNADGAVLYAVLPALPTGTTSVNVTLPGFHDLTDVRVGS